MLKRIDVAHLKAGMYITSHNSPWLPQSKVKGWGLLKNNEFIEKLVQLNIGEVCIDTSKGLDSPHAEELPDLQPTSPLESELEEARKIYRLAKTLVKELMVNLKLGKPTVLAPITQLADRMLDSVLRNKNALICLGCIRNKDNYLLEHSVNVSTLMSVFCLTLKMSRKKTLQAIVGALLHDIGKVLIVDEILGKPGKLTAIEFDEMKRHVSLGYQFLQGMDGFSELSKQVVVQHHERMDGQGYPAGLSDTGISVYGRMAAIVDVYDAVTADRCYRQGLTPCEAIKRLKEWSGTHLDAGLVDSFLQCIGDFPVGSLVLLASGKLAVVVEENAIEQHKPVVHAMYHTRFKSYIRVEVLDLASKSVKDRIERAVNPGDYNIQTGDFI